MLFVSICNLSFDRSQNWLQHHDSQTIGSRQIHVFIRTNRIGSNDLLRLILLLSCRFHGRQDSVFDLIDVIMQLLDFRVLQHPI